MPRRFYVLASALLLTACGSITVPVSGKMEDGTAFAGKATASLSGGTFEAIAPNGIYCTGTYDALSSKPTITMTATCKDGRTANIVSTRNKDMVSGNGTIVLSDGTKGTFNFGKGS